MKRGSHQNRCSPVNLSPVTCHQSPLYINSRAFAQIGRPLGKTLL